MSERQTQVVLMKCLFAGTRDAILYYGVEELASYRRNTGIVWINCYILDSIKRIFKCWVILFWSLLAVCWNCWFHSLGGQIFLFSWLMEWMWYIFWTIEIS